MKYFFTLLFCFLILVNQSSSANPLGHRESNITKPEIKRKYPLSVFGFTWYYHQKNFSQPGGNWIGYLNHFDENRFLIKGCLRGRFLFISLGIGRGHFNETITDFHWDAVNQTHIGVDRKVSFNTFVYEFELRFIAIDNKFSPFFGTTAGGFSSSISENRANPKTTLGYVYGIEYRYKRWSFDLFMKKEWIILDPKIGTSDWPVNHMPSFMVGYSFFND